MRKFVLAVLFLFGTLILVYLVSGLFINQEYSEASVTSTIVVSDVMNKFEIENRLTQYLGLDEDTILNIIEYNMETPSFRIFKDTVKCGNTDLEVFIFVETSETDNDYDVKRVLCNYARIKDGKTNINGRIFTNLERTDNILIQANLEGYSGGDYQFTGFENVANDTSLYSGEKGTLKFKLSYHYRINLHDIITGSSSE